MANGAGVPSARDSRRHGERSQTEEMVAQVSLLRSSDSHSTETSHDEPLTGDSVRGGMSTDRLRSGES